MAAELIISLPANYTVMVAIALCQSFGNTHGFAQIDSTGKVIVTPRAKASGAASIRVYR